jgi:para-aminobenzoate synthetase component 2
VTARVLVVDNYDSFVFNLVQYLGQLDAECVVRRNDEVEPADLDRLGVDGVLLSPGPGRPETAGCSIAMVHACAAADRPLLGVDEATLPDELEVTGRTATGVVMALRHRDRPIEGVQFHPESVMTQGGHLLLANWLAGCGDPAARERAPALAAEVDKRRRVLA